MNIAQYLHAAGVPQDLHPQALASIASAQKQARKVLPYNLAAPLVMALVVPFVPRSASHLPRLFRAWDNEVSINGDGFGVLRDGRWVRVQGNELPGEVAVPYTDPYYGGDAYYAPGHHPRSRWARWVWLGLRNRASMRAFELGPPASTDIEVWGNPATNNGSAGVVVYRMGEHWQVFACSKAGPLCVRRNVGVKARNVLLYGAARAMVVNITFSLQRWRGQR